MPDHAGRIVFTGAHDPILGETQSGLHPEHVASRERNFIVSCRLFSVRQWPVVLSRWLRLCVNLLSLGPWCDEGSREVLLIVDDDRKVRCEIELQH